MNRMMHHRSPVTFGEPDTDDAFPVRDMMLLQCTSSIVAGYLGGRPNIGPSEIPALIRDVHTALAGLDAATATPAPVEPLVPAVPIRKSITDDAIICLEDGKRFQSLKRHLQSAFGLTPEEYRKKWNLPADYPMVAPNYSAKRTELAKSMGLGTKANKGI